MKIKQILPIKIIRTALLLAGGAFCIISCSREQEVEHENNEGLMTQEAFYLTIIESTNGKLSNKFEAPLTETYQYAREPYREFRKGIKVTTFDSETGEVESTLVADYAIQFINQQLWEAKGNVVATNAKGDKLETQQLFWNQRTERIYSNIDSKLTQGGDVIIGIGFESDEQFKDWEFRRPRGTVDVDIESTKNPGPGTDTTAGEEDDDPAEAAPVRRADPAPATVDRPSPTPASQVAAPIRLTDQEPLTLETVPQIEAGEVQLEQGETGKPARGNRIRRNNGDAERVMETVESQ